MATKKTTKKSASAQRRNLSSELQEAARKLRAVGVYKPTHRIGKTVTRSQQRHIKKLVTQFEPVLTGKATIAKTTKKTAEKFKQQGLTTKFNKVVIPLEGAEKAYIPKGKEEIVRVRTRKGQRVKETIKLSVAEKNIPRGKNIRYSIMTNGFKTTSNFKHLDDFIAFFNQYQNKSHINAVKVTKILSNKKVQSKEYTVAQFEALARESDDNENEPDI